MKTNLQLRGLLKNRLHYELLFIRGKRREIPFKYISFYKILTVNISMDIDIWRHAVFMPEGGRHKKDFPIAPHGVA